MMDFTELRLRLRGVDTASLCDADKPTGVLKRVSGAIRPINADITMVGRAHTVQCHEDFLTVVKGLKEAQPGDVLVIDSQGTRRAVSGGLFPTEAKRKGLAGIVVDGPVRDLLTIRELAFPYFARKFNCIPAPAERLYETQIPVQCGGVPVHPGDVLVGDDDGIIVATEHEMATLLPIAEEIKAKESHLVAQINCGVSLLDMLNFEDHCASLSAGEKSKLQFLV